MKKQIKIILVAFLLFFANTAFAKTVKIIGQTTSEFNPYNPPEVFYVKILEKVYRRQ